MRLAVKKGLPYEVEAPASSGEGQGVPHTEYQASYNYTGTDANAYKSGSTLTTPNMYEAGTLHRFLSRPRTDGRVYDPCPLYHVPILIF